MIKNKIQMVLQYNNAKQTDLVDILEMSSKQALNNKFAKNRFTIQDVIKICDNLGCELIVKDKNKNEQIIKFDMSDI